MEVATITMEKHEARAKLKAYRAGLHRRADEEWEAAARGFEKLAEGVALLNIADVFRDCPVDEKGRPRLAIARADRKQVRVEHRTDWRGGRKIIGYEFQSDALAGHWNGRAPESLRIRVETREREDTGHHAGWALVPMVPPDVEPRRSILRYRSILWEVEEWADRRVGAAPDIDPYLLEHLGGDLYAVVGAWDLTDLERAVMAGRAEQ